MDEAEGDVERARYRWLDADRRAADLAGELFQPGTGYGDPEARRQDEHRLEAARHDADRLRFTYLDLDRRQGERQMIALQQSQRRAAWASFTVAAVVGAATVASVLVALFT